MRVLRKISLVAVCFLAMGCSSWHLIQPDEFEGLNENKPYIRVVLKDGSVYETKNYQVGKDSLILFTSKTPFFKANRQVIPMARIASIKKLEIDAEGVALLSVVTVLAFYAIDNLSRGLSRGFSSIGH